MEIGQQHIYHAKFISRGDENICLSCKRGQMAMMTKGRFQNPQ